jgi:hypothetical protein
MVAQLMSAYQSLPAAEVDPDLAFHRATAVFACLSGKCESISDEADGIKSL